LKRIYFTVTNDLLYDQRMIRICRSLAANGYAVLLVGRRLHGSPPLREEPFEQKRLRCLFGKGRRSYLEYNLRLLLFLLFRRMDGICAIDLDTIVPCLWISRWKKIPRIYDAHELFTEMKEVITRPRVKIVWMRVERYAVPQYNNGYTVSRSIAGEFRKRYGVNYDLIRNLPVLEDSPPSPSPPSSPSSLPASPLPSSSPPSSSLSSPSSLPPSALPPFPSPFPLPYPGWQPGERFILYQGAVNEARGLESLIGAMRQVDCPLLICGDGPRMEACRTLAKDYGLTAKIIFRGMTNPAELRGITKNAYIGVNLVEALGLNQYYSLANKFFDYIHAGVPQVTMDFPEYRTAQDRYPTGLLIPDTEEKKIREALNNLLENGVLYAMFRENCQRARLIYNWQEEEKTLLRFYKKIFG
jgi:glycosyltransferase involved in cell wall biosynthesis